MDHEQRNRRAWTRWAPEYVEPGRKSLAQPPQWGIWGIPEAEIGLLPPCAGLDTLEVGCGAGYISGWLSRMGARPVGIDITPAQLATARQLRAEFELGFDLIYGTAERLPLADATFDLVVSEYGASIWCDPYRWIPEASRVLRRNGLLVFLVNATLLMLCVSDDDAEPAGLELRRPYFGMHRFEWPTDESVEFHIPHGEMLALLRSNGFAVERLAELGAPEGATSRYEFVTAEWARRYPSEEAWVARKL